MANLALMLTVKADTLIMILFARQKELLNLGKLYVKLLHLTALPLGSVESFPFGDTACHIFVVLLK